jgi:hypothetical protein
MSNYKTLDELAKDFPNKADREEQLKKMNCAQIDVLIRHMNNIQGKIYLQSFKSKRE